MKRVLFFIFITFMIATSCEKKQLQSPEVQPGPKIYLSGKFDGSSFYYGAGEDSIIAETAFLEDTSFKIRGWGMAFLDERKENKPIVQITITHAFQMGDPWQESLGFNIAKDTLYDYQGFTPFKRIVDFAWFDDKNIFPIWVSESGPETFFIITKSEDFIDEGKVYRKVHIEFECQLFNTLTSSIVRITEGKGVIVFGGV